MPSDHRFLINLRGTPEYERALLRLVKAAIKAGAPLEPGELNRMTELAIAAYAEAHKVKLPPRIPPQGTNQHAKKPKGKPTP